MFENHRLILAGLAASAGLLLAACGGGSSNEAAGVVSLDTESDVDSASDEAAAAEVDTEEAQLEFAQCVRDAGIEAFPDPQGGANGGFGFGGGGLADAGIDPQSQEFQDAIDQCSELLDGATFGGGGRGGFADNVELQDTLVEYGDCLRAEGLDVGDITFGQGGGGQGGAGQGGPGGQGGGPGQGQAQGGGGPGAGIANALGLDAEDPAVAAALEVCQPILESAFSQFGPGAADDEQ